MENDTKMEEPSFKGYYTAILTYINSHEPSTKEVLEFVGVLIHSVTDMMNLTPNEKEFYRNTYNRLLTKKLSPDKTKRKADALVI